MSKAGGHEHVRVPSWLDGVKFDAKGLVPAIVQDTRSKEVLMMAYMNREALEKTLATGKTHFYSRSRRKLWMKGEASGHVQRVKRISLDCDGDTVLVQVRQTGGACHTGFRSCFFRTLSNRGRRVWKTVGKKLFDPDKVYSTSLRGLRGETEAGRSNLDFKTRLPKPA